MNASICLVLVALLAAFACFSGVSCKETQLVSVDEEMRLLADDARTLGEVEGRYLRAAGKYNEFTKSGFYLVSHLVRVIESSRKNIIMEALLSSQYEEMVARKDLLRAHELAHETVTPYLTQMQEQCVKRNLDSFGVGTIQELLLDRMNEIDERRMSQADKRT